MQKKITTYGFLTMMVWLILVWPTIAGYVNGLTINDLNKNYLSSIGINYFSNIAEAVLLTVVFILVWLLYCKAIQDSEKNSSIEVLVWTTVFTSILVFLFPFACEDVYYYIATGQIQVQYQANPYITAAHQISNWPSDPLLRTSGWGFLVNVYGPIWTKVTQLLVSLAGSNLLQAILLFKCFAGLIHLLNVVLIGLTATKYNVKPVQAMLIYGWNPLLLFELPGHAHNDALLITFMLLGFFTLNFCRGIFSIPMLTLALLVKYTPVLLISLFSLWLMAKQRIIILLSGLLISLIVTVIIWLPYWQGIETLAGLFKQMNFYSIKSLHYLAFNLLHLWQPQISKLLLFEQVSQLLALLFIISLLFILIKFWLARPNVNSRLILNYSIIIFLLYLFLANKWFQPWYLAWLIPIGALLNLSNNLSKTTLLLSLSAELSRVPQILFNYNGFFTQACTFFIAWVPLFLLYRRPPLLNIIAKKRI